jgi:hypothetical protein
MPLAVEEIVPGAVAILESAPLLGNPDVTYADDQGPFRPGPFLCVAVKDGVCQWLHLTSRRDPRGLRLEIRPEWRLEGSQIWRNTPQYVSDARKPFAGPFVHFVAAGANELPHRPHNRPHVSAEGVTAAVGEMARYGVRAL